MSEAMLESGAAQIALSRALDAASTGVLRIVCGLGLANAVLMVLITVVGRPTPFSITAASAWATVWLLMLNHADGLRLLLLRRPRLLIVTAMVGMAPVAMDGGLEGTLGTQALWITWIAAVTVGASMTLATVAAMTVAVGAALAASGMSAHDLISGPNRFQAALLICNPLVVGAVGLAIVGVFHRILTGVADGLADIRAGGPASTLALTKLLHAGQSSPAPLLLTPPRAGTGPTRPWGLTSVEQAVVARLRAGLTVQQIALERHGSVLTVRTHIKRAKRKVGARTLNELIARTWPAS